MAAVAEDSLKPACMRWKTAISALAALLVIFPAAVPVEMPAAQAKPVSAAPATGNKPLAKIWHSEATQHDFRVEVSNDLFRAEWVNIPPAAAKQGVYIRTECRRSGSKWVGRSSLNMVFGVPGAPQGKDTKVCSLTVRFEVDSVSPQKITGHSESLRNFDVKTCQVEKTSWGNFTWVPKQ